MPRIVTQPHTQQVDSDSDDRGSRHHDALPHTSRRAYAVFLYDNPGILPQQMSTQARLALAQAANRPLPPTMDLLYTFTSRRDRGAPINKKWLVNMLEQIRVERGDTEARKALVLAPTAPVPAPGVRRRHGRVAHRQCAGLPAAPIQTEASNTNEEDVPAPVLAQALPAPAPAVMPAPTPVFMPAPVAAPAPVPTPATYAPAAPIPSFLFRAPVAGWPPVPAIAPAPALAAPWLPSPLEDLTPLAPLQYPLLPLPLPVPAMSDLAPKKETLESIQVASPLLEVAASPLTDDSSDLEGSPQMAQEDDICAPPTVPGMYYPPTVTNFSCGVNMPEEDDAAMFPLLPSAFI